ncbi:hypothetical protein G6L68_25050 [Agrobacterium fabrum]|uniref:hypothetical protein n=1 Tax=Agrobacterium fabrum TaxID=1176649 RepID=UPI000EF5ED8C|nr:hypothetical protein [Agrobacterium fabrum]AYM66154.1 hypothetical protein At12D13_50020 [Agrobacterium fabrum]NTE63901.1 hypothetical protein [Agrobacterium fabrum]
MPKATAQNISLISCADWMSTPAHRRQEVANGGVPATVYCLMRRTVSCPKGSVINIMSSNFGGEELVELALFAGRRDIDVVSDVSFDGLTSEADTLRAACVAALVAGRYQLGERYARLLEAVEKVEEARRGVAIMEYWYARVDLEQWHGAAARLISLRGAVIVNGKAAGLTDEQIEDDIAAIMEARAATKIAA